VLELLDLRDRRERLEPRRLEIDPDVSATVRDAIERVRREGDAALLDLTLRFDGADLREGGLVATPDEFVAAFDTVPVELRSAIDAVVERLIDLHTRQLPVEWRDERDGVRFGERVTPLRAVGCYVPGGRAVYPSSVAMTVVPAFVAGVGQIVVCTPPRSDGSIHPLVLYAAKRAGATMVVKAGGAQGIAALTFGTNSVPSVDKIVGPGNAFVTEAKRQVSGVVGIDGLAGATELAIVAGSTADVRWLAADLVAQAEHDPDAIATLVVLDPDLVEAVEKALEAEVAKAARRDVVEVALANARAVIVKDLEQAVDAVNDLAPEHLQVAIDDAATFVSAVRAAGAIFVGPFTPVPFGDYGVASNHVLPTSGTARFANGLRSSDFVRVTSVVEMTDDAAARLAPEISALARSEGLIGHARAVEIRAEDGGGA
jgi:histidinol dehydrogenase